MQSCLAAGRSWTYPFVRCRVDASRAGPELPSLHVRLWSPGHSRRPGLTQRGEVPCGVHDPVKDERALRADLRTLRQGQSGFHCATSRAGLTRWEPPVDHDCSPRRSTSSCIPLEQMTAAGFTHVYDLAGGIGTWQNMADPWRPAGPDLDDIPLGVVRTFGTIPR